jgi:hypothetical protein
MSPDVVNKRFRCGYLLRELLERYRDRGMIMDSGTAAVLGASVGVVGSLLTTWLNAILTRSGDKQYERKTMEILREALQKGENWQSLPSLAALIGAPEGQAKELLIMLGARTRQSQPSMWGLRSKNPFPDRLPIAN